MLEIRNLSKVYRSKTGDEVKALDNVSISFPESGMVFILGKSGSGKSTLLNIMGGLDSYDSGEFIIKGKSSKDFAGSDFDAYRNTFIGFIFQEYNVLDDFTVGANIALALELQGKKATSEKINEILSQVDLLNYAKRKPNELSGGQKQRVAIARALVKEPQIIMADEPTGALDSNTGKQIFDSLKKLSREKLVLIVSHDRDFAERYADRIVELADGKIISDVTKHEHESEKLSEGIDKLSGQILRIKGGYRLTEADLRMINEYLSGNNGDVILSGDTRVNDELRSAAGISERGTMSVFEGTNAERDVPIKKYEKKDSRFIRSRLPAKNALRMGAGGLKHKKFRLTMTVLLSLIAFALFGFADTMAAYNKLTSAVDSVVDSNVKNASVTLGVRRTITTSDGEVEVDFISASLNDADLAYLRETVGLDFVPVFTGVSADYYGGGGFSVASQMNNFSATAVYTGKIHGMVEFDAAKLQSIGYSITGRLPERQGEIAITELMYRQFKEFGFRNSEFDESVAAGSLTMDENSASSIIGKHITLSNGLDTRDGKGYSFVIVGVVDTQFDYTRYEAFLPQQENSVPVTEESNMITDTVLQMEIQSELNYGFHGLGFTTKQDIEQLASMSTSMGRNLGTYMNGWGSDYFISIGSSGEESKEEQGYGQTFHEVAPSTALSQLKITWLDGRTDRTALAANEVVLPSNFLQSIYPQQVTLTVDESALVAEAVRLELFDASAWTQTDASSTYYDRLLQAMDDKQDQWENEQLMKEKLAPYIASLYGITLDAGASADSVYMLMDNFRSISAENPEYTVDRWQIADSLRRMQAQKDVSANRLWENTQFKELMFAAESFGVSQEDWDRMAEADRKMRTEDFYAQYLSNGYDGFESNAFGTATGKELEEKAKQAVITSMGMTEEELLTSLVIKRCTRDYELQNVSVLGEYDFKIVGVYDSNSYRFGSLIVSDTVLADYKEWSKEQMQGWSYTEEFAPHDDGIWAYAVAPLGTDVGVIRKLVEMSYDETQTLQFVMQNPIMDTLESFNSFIEVGAKIFMYVGIGFALFSALLLMNFISTSISYKKREIGVLRAVGARSSDVFKIFFSEALIIAAINFVLSTAAVIAGIAVANGMMHRSGINITLLHYGVRQFVLMLLISVAVALLASFLPVYNIAKKKPVDAIKDR
ncbi:MAG: ABC transporter ATP-binding protein/permease [Clostridia bacterium]|nr:ABC transporter ATP-binding protein/permease [Clostridia bacterium]